MSPARSGILALVAALMLSVLSAIPARAASLVEVAGFGSNPGNLRMFKYIPNNSRPNIPVVVVLHGCFQTASLYGPGSGWVKMAETYRFALVVPQQQPQNDYRSCFTWFRQGDNRRGAGETLSIKQMVDNVKANHSVDPARVFVTGLSGGGYMTSVMIAAYPDVFAGGGIVAGGPSLCADFDWQSFMCVSGGVNRTPQQWGNLVRAASGWSGPWPKVSVWNGQADSFVNPMNLTEVVEQWTNLHGTDQTPDAQETVKGYPRKVYHNSSGVPVVEAWLLPGQPHGRPLDPGSAPDQCGTAGSAGMVDMNICAAYHMVPFFRLDQA